ncbi:MAG: hypothetical protein IJC15_09210 [Clostridia bacterium]|nr:hypothetical protein [Clostridia bacterium]
MQAKWIGAGLILTAALVLAHRLSAAERAGLRRTEAWLELVRQMRRQIACYSRPPGEILRRIDPTLAAACGLDAASGKGLAEMLERAEQGLLPDAVRVVREVALELGRGYLAEQISLLDAAIGELEEITASGRRRLPERIRLIRCACICGGLAVILLLL